MVPVLENDRLIVTFKGNLGQGVSEAFVRAGIVSQTASQLSQMDGEERGLFLLGFPDLELRGIA